MPLERRERTVLFAAGQLMLFMLVLWGELAQAWPGSQPRIRTSILTGRAWVQELQDSPIETRIRENRGVTRVRSSTASRGSVATCAENFHEPL
jgi:hypothetical protein